MEKQTMKNKLTKIGVSALCGSLAAVASQAGEMSVSGSATATWTKGSQTTNGNPIGMNSGLTFKGTGELDNGSTIAYTLTHADKAAYSVGSMSLTTPSMGTISLSHASGGQGIGGYDDKMPTAWEETWGNGVGTGVDLAKGVASSTNIQWASPTMFGSTIKVAYAPKNDGAQSNDKATSGAANSGKKSGIDVVIDMKPIEGFNLWVGGSKTDRYARRVGVLEDTDDHQEVNIGGVFTMGPVSVGFAKSGEFTGNQAAGDVDYYVNTMYGVSFNVNDDLSLSYGNFDSKKRAVQPAGNSADVEIESWQVAYSMGGAAIKLAKTDSDNAVYTTAKTGDKDAVVMALSLAF